MRISGARIGALFATALSVSDRECLYLKAFATREIIKAYRDLLARKSSPDIGFNSLMGYYLDNPSDRAQAVSERLQDLGARRIADMDATTGLRI